MKRSLSVIDIILSVVTVIVMTVCLLVLGVQKPIEKTLEKENLEEIMEDIDIEKIFFDEKGNETAMGKRIYAYFDNIGLKKEEVNMVVKDKNFKVIIGSYLGTMFLNGITGVEVIYPTRGELVNFIHNNYSRFQNVTKFPKDYKQEEIERIVAENYSNVKKELDELAKDIKFNQIKNIELIRSIFNINSWILIAATITCSVLLILIKKIFKWLRLAGITGAFSGIIFVLIGLFGSKLLSLFIDMKDYKEVLEPIVKNVAKNMLIYGIFLIAISAVVMVCSFFAKPKVKELKEEISE